MSALRKNRYAPKTQIQDVPYFVPKSTAGGAFDGTRRNEKRRLSVFFVDPSVRWTSVDQILERETRQSPVIYPLEILKVWPTSAIPMDKILDYFEGVGKPVLSTALHSPHRKPSSSFFILTDGCLLRRLG